MPIAPEGIVEALQVSLSLHWTAVESYETQSVHFATWGYSKIAEEYAAAAEEERGHARKVMARVEFFNTAPTTVHEFAIWTRHDYLAVLDQNHEIETSAADAERDGYVIAIDSGDAVTAGIFAELLADSEEAIQKIEAIREVIGTIGLDNYLADKI